MGGECQWWSLAWIGMDLVGDHPDKGVPEVESGPGLMNLAARPGGSMSRLRPRMSVAMPS